MNLRAPNMILFLVASGLALVGVLSALPIAMPIPGMTEGNAPWYIFLGWFMLAAGSVGPQQQKPIAAHQS